jgi:hypothetical protein
MKRLRGRGGANNVGNERQRKETNELWRKRKRGRRQITIDGREQMKKTNDIGDLEAEERNK